MAAATRGLSTADIAGIRETLTSGRKPKVVFTESAGQVAGKIGQVIELTDPKASDEWIVVRFGRDELPFSPADLAIPSKAPAAKATPAPAEPEPGPPLRLTEPPQPIKVKTVPSPREEPRMPASNTNTPAAASNGAAENGKASASAPQDGTLDRSQAANGAMANGAAKPAKAAKPKPVASLTVTLAYTDREWTIAAPQGAKTLAK